MEEKLLALEGLGVLRGFLPEKKWNVNSSSVEKKNDTRDSQIKAFQRKECNVIQLQGQGTTQMINQETEGENECKDTDIEDDRKEVFLESCKEMEIKGTETYIPECDKPVMNENCDKIFSENNEKTEESDKFKYKQLTENNQGTVIKDNSFDETSEEIESSENEEVSEESSSKKIPSTVQEWVNHLPLKESPCSKENSDCKELKEESHGESIGEDNSLAKAQLSREASLQSSSSLDSILDSRRPDPVEIFLNLGFGGLPGIDTENCRIPKRFLVPSKCKGGDWNEFLKRELIQAQNFECSSLGFRGLSGPSYRRPSAIVANIMEKLRERAVSQPHNKSRFSTVARMVLNEKSVLNKLTPEFQSVLSPDNRKFLQNQGQKSPEVPRRRIIFGQKSFAFAHDGEFVEVESSKAEEKTKKDCPTTLSPNDGGEEPPPFPNAEVLLKLRRSSLQKQKNVEEDTDVDDVFYVVESEERSNEPSFNGSECSKKAGKIPRRFLSSTNLIALEENSLSETMRLEVEKEIMGLSQKIKNISSQDLPSVLKQVKELRSKIENAGQEPSEM